MKAIQKQSTTAATVQRKSEQPFFQKQGEEAAVAPEREAFLSGGDKTGVENRSDSPFFQKPSRPVIQAKLTIGQPGDPYEQEADAMAEKVVQRLAENNQTNPVPLNGNGLVSPKIQRKPIFESNTEPTIQAKFQASSAQTTPLIQAKCADCEQEEKLQKKEEQGIEEQVQMKPIFENNGEPPETPLQPKLENTPFLQKQCAKCAAEEEPPGLQKQADSTTSTAATPSLESRLSSSRGGGSPLPENTRTQMEGAFGSDFSGVRVHTDSSAVQMNKELGAQAFTHGSDVYFNGGKYSPDSTDGQKLLAHELTHTVQQGGASAKPEKQPASRWGGNQSADSQAVQLKDDTEPKPIKTDKTNLPSVETSVDSINWRLRFLDKEPIFRELLRHQGLHAKELRDKYQEKYKISLDDDLSKLGELDAFRAKHYLDYGKLRIIDKLYLASKTAATDEETLFRLLPTAAKTYKDVEEAWANDPDCKAAYSAQKLLPNKQMSYIGGLLEDELSGWELDKGKALYTYAELRPTDEVRIALLKQEIPALMEGLKTGMKRDPDKTLARNGLAAEYLFSYGEDLLAKLGELKALGVITPEDTIKVDHIIGLTSALDRIKTAVNRLGTDEEEIFDAIKTATGTELQELRDQFANQQSELYKLLKDDLNEEEMNRVTALLAADPTAMQQLQQVDATSSGEIRDEIKMSSGDRFYNYKDAYNNNKDQTFSTHIAKQVQAEDHAAIVTILNGTPEQKLSLAISGTFTDDEEYIFHVLKHFVANDPAKQAISDNKDLMARLFDALTTDEDNKVKDLLRLESESLDQKVQHTSDRAKREDSWLNNMFSRTGDAMNDELRELEVGLEVAKSDGELSPAEQKALGEKQEETDKSIDVYIKVRDELENNASFVLTTVVAVLVAVGTGGLGAGASAAMIAQQLAQAALISALARVAAMKVAKGDRFEMFGADGAGTFAAGAVDGVFNVFGGALAKKIVDKALEKVAIDAAREAAGTAFQTVGQKILSRATAEAAIEGGMSAGIGTMVETSSKEETWNGGFVKGVNNVVDATASSALAGGGIGAGLNLAGAIISHLRAAKGKDGGIPPDPNAPHSNEGLAGEAKVNQIKEETLNNTLKSTARKQGTELTQAELNAEIAWAAKNGEVKPSTQAGYTHEIELNNGHTLRRNEKGLWCRFSDNGVCNIDPSKVLDGKMPGKGANQATNKKWDDPTLSKEQMTADYKAKNPTSRLTDKEIADYYDAGYRVNPETGAFKRPPGLRPGWKEDWQPPKHWNGPANHGEWDGPKGNSNWFDSKPEVIRIVGEGPIAGKSKPIVFYKGKVDLTAYAKETFEVPGLVGTKVDGNADFSKIYEQIAIRKKLLKSDGSPNKSAAIRWLSQADDGYGGQGLTAHHAGGDTIELIPSALHNNVQHTDMSR